MGSCPDTDIDPKLQSNDFFKVLHTFYSIIVSLYNQ